MTKTKRTSNKTARISNKVAVKRKNMNRTASRPAKKSSQIALALKSGVSLVKQGAASNPHGLMTDPTLTSEAKLLTVLRAVGKAAAKADEATATLEAVLLEIVATGVWLWGTTVRKLLARLELSGDVRGYTDGRRFSWALTAKGQRAIAR